MTAGNPIDVVLAQLDRPRQIPGGGWQARCPVPSHGKQRGDRNPSLSVTEAADGKVLVHCHTGCSTDAVLDAIGLQTSDLFPHNGTPAAGNGKQHIVATYDYQDEASDLISQVVRYDPKGFCQRRPDGSGGWEYNVRNTRKVLFRLPELLAADSTEPVFLVEGEKDTLNLTAIGVVATTGAGGAGKWRSEYSETLRGRHVVILPDNDTPGRNHAHHVAQELTGIAASVKVVELPELPQAGDVSDWLSAGGSRNELLKLAEAAFPWSPEQATPLPDAASVRTPLPKVIATGRLMHDVTADMLAALKQQNDPPRLFERGGELCRVRWDERGRPKIQSLTEAMLRGEMDRAVVFMVVLKDGTQVIKPPSLDVVRDLSALPKWGFPVLDGVVEIPVLRPDGTVLDRPGYDAATRLYYCPAPGLVVPPIPDEPTRKEIDAALVVIMEVLRDFPFADDPGYTNAVGLMLTPILRPIIDGPVPLALIDAPQKGTGKTLLGEAIAIVATGQAELLGAPRKEEEWGKLMTSTLLSGATFIMLDNLKDKVYSPTLERTLTSSILKDRVLGASRMVELPQRATWVGTANNVDLSGDLTRRCYWIRLDAKMAMPWRGRTFAHPDLLGWVREHRGDVVAALLTLARAWFAAGRPKSSTPTLGKYESWCEVVGGVLAHAGDQNFLGNLDQMYESMDEESGQWEAFLRGILQKFEDRLFTVSMLMDEMVLETEGKDLQKLLPDELRDALEAVGPDGVRRGFSRKLGIALRRHKEIRYGDDGIHLRPAGKEPHTASALWSVAEGRSCRSCGGL